MTGPAARASALEAPTSGAGDHRQDRTWLPQWLTTPAALTVRLPHPPSRPHHRPFMRCALEETIMSAPDRTPIRVLLVDDHEMVLHGLRAMLARSGDGRGGRSGRRGDRGGPGRRRASRPDVVLCDVRLRSDSGWTCVAHRAVHPAIKVVFLTVYDDEQYLYQALRAGASGYLLKRVDGDELVRHLERVSAGDVVIDPSLAGRVAAVGRAAAARGVLARRPPGADPARERGALAARRAVSPTRRSPPSSWSARTPSRPTSAGCTASSRSTTAGPAVAVALREGLFH